VWDQFSLLGYSAAPTTHRVPRCAKLASSCVRVCVRVCVCVCVCAFVEVLVQFAQMFFSASQVSLVVIWPTMPFLISIDHPSRSDFPACRSSSQPLSVCVRHTPAGHTLL
jgi:hypothetical protein